LQENSEWSCLHPRKRCCHAFLNNYMAGMSFHRELKAKEGRPALNEIPEKLDWSWFMAEVASSFAALYTSEAADKLKICQNPECRWLFIDESKSRNRKWCDDTCSTLMKVRRFRQKTKS
jgi:predicted RNA-binding Zn ribbon-like protein